MRVAVLVFPGSTGEEDLYHALKDGLGVESESGAHSARGVDYVWHETTDLSAYDAIFLPSGATYGDYLRPGALAAHAPVMKAVQKAADAGKPVVGVGNGFQILLEAGLLPGAVRRNESLQFQCATVELEVVNNETMFTRAYAQGQTISIPIAHAYGNYYCDAEMLSTLEANKQILFRYTENQDGSIAQIAGIMNAEGNVLGMMPHPERALEQLLGSTDGLPLFKSIYPSWRERDAHV